MTEHILDMAAPPDVYRQRRARLASHLVRPLVIFAGRTRTRNPANDYPFRAASTYLYFGGPPIQGAAWLIQPDGHGDDAGILIRPQADPDDALWMGEPPPDELLASAAGLGRSAVAGPDQLHQALAGRSATSICPPCPSAMQWAASLGLEPAGPEEFLPIIDMRLIKDRHELEAMRRAAEVSVIAHQVAMMNTVPHEPEALVAACFRSVLDANQCAPSFSPIVTVRGAILHCTAYNNIMKPGHLLLIDGGAEEPGGYACDITRVCPVSGEFTPIQKHIYQIVLRAERAAVAECVPGRRYRDVHDLAARVICEGLVQAELLRGDAQELADRRAHALFFPHGVGHLIGLDVHDMEDYGDIAGYSDGRRRRPGFGDKFLRLDRDLKAGMTVTIEPGIYFVPAVWQRDDLVKPFADCVNRPAVDALLRDNFGGIRLEDTVHVTNTGGPEVLTKTLPIEADAVASIVRAQDKWEIREPHG